MKVLIVFSALVAVSLADQEFYTTGNDNLDVDQVAKDPASTRRYLDCFLDKGPCDALALSYKLIIHDSLLTACIKCNPAQKHLWNRFLYYLKSEYPEDYEAFQRKYDPLNLFIPVLNKVIAKFGNH